MFVPEGGLGKRLDEMHEWHRARGFQARFGRSRRDEDNRDYLTWCFAGAEGLVADEPVSSSSGANSLASRFNGALLIRFIPKSFATAYVTRTKPAIHA